MHHSIIHIENPTRCNSVSKFISYLYEAQHVSEDTPPIIRSLKLHWQPLDLHKWKVVGRVVVGRCQTESYYRKSNNMQQFIKIYFIFVWSSTCFGRHNAHHQEPKTALAASVFFIIPWKVVGRLAGGRCQAHCAWHRPPATRPTTFHGIMKKPEAASTVLGSWWWAVWRPKHVELHINME